MHDPDGLLLPLTAGLGFAERVRRWRKGVLGEEAPVSVRIRVIPGRSLEPRHVDRWREFLDQLNREEGGNG